MPVSGGIGGLALPAYTGGRRINARKQHGNDLTQVVFEVEASYCDQAQVVRGLHAAFFAAQLGGNPDVSEAA